MKKTLLFLAIFSTSVSVSIGQLSWGVRAGINFSGSHESVDRKFYTSHTRTGFHAGFNAEVPFFSGLLLQPGLLFTTKGSTSKDDDWVNRISYIELPLNVIFKTGLANGNLLLGAGPYLAAGVGGSHGQRQSGIDFPIKFANDISEDQFREEAKYSRRFDTGVNVLAGFEFANRLSLQLNGQLGLRDISPQVEGESYYYKSGNYGFGLSAGYRL